MDTRSKIVSDPLLARGATVVIGYFDLLQPWHLAQLNAASSAGGKVAAVVLPLENALLSQRARAELAASLRMLDYVIIADDVDLETLLARLAPAATIRLEEDDLRRRGQLIEHVQQRQIR
jgi:glycerol-3-phosphate cytidylyltransferase-like family protein